MNLLAHIHPHLVVKAHILSDLLTENTAISMCQFTPSRRDKNRKSPEIRHFSAGYVYKMAKAKRFTKKSDTVVGQTDLAGMRDGSSAHKPCP